MKYQKQLDKLKSGNMSRSDIARLKTNAEALVAKGDEDARVVLEAINGSTPSDGYILFMGFCPNADFNQREDIEWKREGTCRLDYPTNKSQIGRWTTICPGDLIVLKKRETFGKTMKLYGHGRVKKIAYDDDIRYFEMDWSAQEQVIEVPLMACNATVDIKSMETVEAEMPEAFWNWLNSAA
ncbi:hypothetical protein [Alteromonas confluentis]|uniref:Uncharacterized protein n=1 Tax=Alteromonas confluentis TaxID=1656094 RepID=A0A1E7ZEX1_9ALTE|nr:hypothetical protein [Alteromonas confluentis]OFC71992.1 hypothetical protein BFC18_04615 [Alteromonas confluentis]